MRYEGGNNIIILSNYFTDLKEDLAIDLYWFVCCVTDSKHDKKTQRNRVYKLSNLSEERKCNILNTKENMKI